MAEEKKKKPEKKAAEKPAKESKPKAAPKAAAKKATAPKKKAAPAKKAAAKKAAPAKKPAKKEKAAPEILEPAGTAVATARYLRVSAQKLRLVADQVRGQDLSQARSTLAFSPRAGAKLVEKVISSAAANAENNHDLSSDDLYVRSIYINEGPTLKRFQPRAMGRAFRIRKRTCHLTVELAERREG